MISKYIQQFMDDNDLSVDEEFFIKNMDGQKVLISFADRYKIVDVDGGILEAVLGIDKVAPNGLLEVTLMDLLRGNYFVEKKPFCPVIGESYYFINPSGGIVESLFAGVAQDFLLCKYVGAYKTKEAATKNVSRCLKKWEEIKRNEY